MGTSWSGVVRIALVGLAIAIALAAAQVLAGPAAQQTTADRYPWSSRIHGMQKIRPLGTRSAAQTGPTEVSADVLTNTTWTYDAMPYLVTRDVRVAAGATLTIEPGVFVFFDQGTGLTVNGRLIASGQRLNSILFLGGDGTPGSWNGIDIVGSAAQPSTGSFLAEAMIMGGGGRHADLYVENGDATIEFTWFIDSSGPGLWLGPGSSGTQIRNNSYFNTTTNRNLGLRNDNPAAVDAPLSFWGDESGPYHLPENPNGLGQPVGDNVRYDPWLIVPPELAIPPSTETIGAGGGELVSGPFHLIVPSGAVAGDTTFKVDPLNRPPVLPGLQTIGAFTLLAADGSIVDFGGKELTVQIAYDDSWIASVDESTLALYFPSGSSVSSLPCRVNRDTNVLTCTTTHFTDFEIAGSPVATPTPRAGAVPVPTRCPGCARTQLPLALRNQGMGVGPGSR